MASLKSFHLFMIALLSFLQPAMALADANTTLASARAPVTESDDAFQFFQEEAKVVTASKSPEKLSDAPGVISVVTKDEIERFGGTTLKDVLELVPGVTVSSVFMTDRTVISIDGQQFQQNGGEVLLLINGRPCREILEGGLDSDMLESIPVNIIERIEVIKGPGSVLYGSGAMAGVINVITEKPEKTTVTATALAGNGAADTSGKVSYKNGELGMLVAGQYRQNPQWNTEWDYKAPSGNVVRNQVSIPDRGPGGYGEIDYKNFRLMSAVSEWHNQFFIPDVPFEKSGPANYSKRFADLGYDLKVNDVWRSEFNVTYTGTDFDSGNVLPGALRRSYELTGEWANFVNPIDKLSLVFGGTENHDNGRNYFTGVTPILLDSHGDRDSKGLYAQAAYAPLRKLKLTGGVQVNKVDGVDLSVDPRADAVYGLTSDLNVKLDYGDAFRAPSINELYLGAPGLHGNPNLKPETVKTADLSLNYSRGPLEAGAHYFYSKQYNLIFQDRSGEFLVPTYNNLGTIESRGAGVDGKYYISKQLLLTGSALYQTSQDQTGASAVSPIATFGVKGGVSYKADRGVTLSAFDIYQGPLASKYQTTVNPSPGAYNILSLNSRFDMFKLTGWEITQHLTLLFRVENLFNQVIWLPNWGMLPGDSLPVDQGRILYSGMEVSF